MGSSYDEGTKIDENVVIKSNTEIHASKSRELVDNAFIKRTNQRIRQDKETENGEFVITITADSEKRSTWPIYRVPQHVRCRVEKYVYTPKLISIGPYHHKDPDLQTMEQHKLRFVMRLFSSSTSPETKNAVEQVGGPLAGVFKKLEVEARNCYSESFDEIDSDEFVRMMILDGCFVVELLRLFAKSQKEYVDDPIFTTRWMMPLLQCDLLMLENQLPFFVLQKVFKLTSSENEASLAQLTLKFLDPLLLRGENIIKKLDVDRKHGHLLGLFRSSFLPSEEKKLHSTVATTPVKGRQLIHSVIDLKDTGIKFKKRENHNLLDIDFNRGVLKIPPLLIHDDTGPVLLNFIAYELCDQYAQPYFARYVSFFGSLLKSTKDFECLHHNGIMNHALGSTEEVTCLFNKLSKEVVYDAENQYLSKQLSDLNKYYNKKWHKWKAQCMRDYCSTPWKFFSLLAAIILLILTFTQTFFSTFSYFHPPS